uniref:Anillin n=1 Tax=Leptobrachium leishanense TaxID=445787 RepID=A0A8C5MSP5_9ANUR
MDPFTEKLLERTRARRENLQKKMADRPTAGTRAAPVNKRPREPLTETNQQPLAPAEEAKPCSKPSPSKRRCSDNVETPASGTENKQPKSPELNKNLQPSEFSSSPIKPTTRTSPAPVLPRNTEEQNLDSESAVGSSVKTRMQRLAVQRHYWDNDATPPISPPKSSPPKETVISPPRSPAPPVDADTPAGRRGRLANLAATIGSWEDDLSHPCVKPNNTQEKPGTACLSKVPTTSSASAGVNGHSVRQEVASASQRPKEAAVNKAPVSSNLSTPSNKVSNKAATSNLTETPKSSAAQSVSFPSSKKRDNDLKPSSEAKALPSASSSQKTERPVSRIYTAQQPLPKDDFKKGTPVQQKDKTATPGGPGIKSFLERFGEKCQERSPAPATPGPRAAVLTPNTKSIQERLLKRNDVSSTASLTQMQKKEREKELAALRGRVDRGSVWVPEKDLTKSKDPQTEVQIHPPTSNRPPKPDVSTRLVPERTPVSNNSRYTRRDEVGVSKPKMEDENITKLFVDTPKVLEKTTAVNAPEIEMNVDGDLNEMNSSEVITEIFSEALEDEDKEALETNDAEGSSKQGDKVSGNESDERDSACEEEDSLNISSMSLLAPLVESVGVGSPEALLSPSRLVDPIYASPKKTKFQRAHVSRAESDSAISAEENLNLLYSIDAYRSQRFKETDRPPIVQTIVRKENVVGKIDEKRAASPRPVNIKQKMKVLSNEVNLQQTVIHQASQALNCCVDEEHGKGSQTEAEAERLLLVATEKRTALIAELNRLKNEGPQSQKKPATRSHDDAPSRGCISVSDIFLPLKADFVCNTSQKPDSANYYFFIMIRAGAENMVTTPLASISSSMKGDALSFPTSFTLEDVSSDFAIDVEVYSLVQRKENIPTDKRKKAVKSKLDCRVPCLSTYRLVQKFLDYLAITPKRLLTSITKSNIHTPALASPGGPNAVRTSNFVLVGSYKLSLSSVGSNRFLLDKVPFLSPLEGHICLKLNCQLNSFVEEKGFLTMFEDVSGFGAWHRRWCVLSGYCISYWTYPDDEKRKNPIGRINIANCTSKKIEPANREFCARPNTFELITVRPQREGDTETLVSQCRDTLCVTKNWLSADTKDERNLWMQKLNQVLVDLRMWQPDACYRPSTKV